MQREIITTRAHGIDISRYQETYVYAQTWGQVDFVIQKMSEGLWMDDKFGALWDQGTSQVAIRGSYHYQRSGVSWKQQADNILTMAAKCSPNLHIVALDVEKINNTLDKTYFADSANILNYLKTNSAYKVILYINPDVFQIAYDVSLKNYGKDGVKWLFDYPMWLGQYWWIASPDKQPGTPKLRGDWDIWQYTEKGDSTKLVDGHTWRHYGSPDLDVFNGTVSQMLEWAGADGGYESPQPDPVTYPTDTAKTIVGVSVAISDGSEVKLK